MVRSYCFLILCILSLTSFGQTGSVSGRVIDSETLEPLPFANVFINNTTLGMATSTEGEFSIRNIPVGEPEIVFSFVGYQTYQTTLNVKDGEDVRLNIKLVPMKEQLAEVKITGTRDKAWERQLKKFEKTFLGADDLGRQCRIVNPYVIEFSKNKGGDFVATASAPIDIENKALGYVVHYYLRNFVSDGTSFSIVGNAKFEEMQAATASEAVQWINNRREAYQGSARHLFKSILEDRMVEEGFRLYTTRGISNSTSRTKLFNQELDRTIIPFKSSDAVSAGNNAHERRLKMGTRIEVHYINEAAIRPAYPDVGHSVSWIDMSNGAIRVSTDGVLLTPLEVVFSGDIGLARISNMLPLDYKPEAIVKMKSVREVEIRRMYEKTYVHTSKSFYYPGEVVWFKAYMNYAVPEMIDTLSQTLYVDLMNADRLVIQTRTVKIDRSGSAAGNFHLPSQLKPGSYALVAYTNWMRNFGSRSYFVKPIPVLDIYERIAPGELPGSDNSRDLEITFDKEKYASREPVKVSISLTDEYDRPLAANLSVSVTDIEQVPVPTWINENIVNGFSIPDVIELGGNRFIHRVEHGVSWYGQFVPDTKKKTKAELTIIRGAFDEVKQVTTAENGTFTLTDMDIPDSTLFSFQALKKGEPYGTVTSRKRDFPFVDFKASDYKVPTERKDNVQRILSTYEVPRDAILLEGVEIKATRLDDKPVEVLNLFGHGDAILKGEEIANAGSMETLLRTRAPGFRLFFDGVHWMMINIRGESTLPPAVINDPRFASINRFPEPVLTIDNRQVIISSGETVGDRLMALQVDRIQRVEISSVSSSYTGSQGQNGVIAVFMKQGTDPDKEKFQRLFLKGYDTPLEFRGPDYSSTTEDHSQGDFRSTLYWNYNLVLDANGRNHFSFFTSDLPGKYRIVIEGVTAVGKPIHVERFIEVEAK
ncbi:MAG TPA: carboxypeptidase-like regulatory domain-containing protein [Cyclobacteriaceae bacterium]|nr:carboxypeptidase-like regulatory domain-containing protein [Cyclobacteriaceae bacterium]